MKKLPNFNYKTNKSITFGLLDNNKVFYKETIKELNLDIFWENFEFNLKKEIYWNQLKKIISILKIIEKKLEKVFKKEKYHNFDFNYLFKKQEKKKLEKWKNISGPALNRYIYKKYLNQFYNYKNNLNILKDIFEKTEENLERISKIVKIIRYLQNDLSKTFNFIENYKYFGNSKKEILKQIKYNKENIKKFLEILNFYSKKDNNQFLVYKIALNPAILNTHSEINKKYYDNLEELEKEVNELDKKNENNKKIKRLFEEELDWFINYILYENWFFEKWEWRTKKYFNENWIEFKNYYNFSKEIFDKYLNFIKNNSWYNLKKHEKYVKNFIEKNNLELYIDFENNFVNKLELIEIENNFLNNILNQEITKGELLNYFKEKFQWENWKNIPKNNFIQILTLLYKLTWKKADLKKKWKNIEKLSEYIRELKWLKNTILKNTKHLYWKFIAPNDKKENKYPYAKKAKIAQNLWQKSSELENKRNFDKELKDYTHFWFIIKKWNRFFIKPFLKEKIINKNWWFTFKEAKEKLEEYKNDSWNYEAFIFKSLTLKALSKLIFIKNAFDIDFSLVEYREIKDIYKRKIYNKNKLDLEKLIKFYLEILNTQKAKDLFPYIDYNFKEEKEYNSLVDFEKDLLKNSYKIDSYKIEIDEKELIELDIVKRTFEKTKIEEIEYKKNNDIKLFTKWFFKNLENYKQDNFDKIRLLPEIKIYIRYKLYEWEAKKEKRWKKEVLVKERFYKDIVKSQFLFELNPLWIWQNPQKEQEHFLNTLKQKDLYHIWIDIGVNELATLWVFKNENWQLIPQEIEVDWEKQKIINLTDLKVDNWKIITQKAWKWKSNSDKFKAIKEMFRQILYWQIYLKEILEDLNETKNIEETLNKYEWKWKIFPKFKSNFSDIYKQFFPWLEKWLKEFLKNSFKDKEINDYLDFYNNIFQKLQLAKVINLKDAFSSNFIWVILKILEEYSWVLIFEALHIWETYSAKDEISKIEKENITKIEAQLIRDFNTYFFPYLLKSVFNKLTKIIEYNENWINIKQYVYLDKNYENSIKSNSKYWNNGIIFWVDEAFTSQACPECNEKLYWIKKDDLNLLYWHGKWKLWEHNMHHCDEPKNCSNIENHISKENKAKCDYHMKQNTYWFNFIKSWDDLAAYNIAKKGKEYIEKL